MIQAAHPSVSTVRCRCGILQAASSCRTHASVQRKTGSATKTDTSVNTTKCSNLTLGQSLGVAMNRTVPPFHGSNAKSMALA
eukprot:CAMPEP_0172920024 /NCGR_PEP_ID=MMETSP1075-20121228/203245_1 /TAXON_ID=2916 /ORGANISM="Ceratium fusus, Strain PA161109" /LENGTH=81 /DNA_ID=CAMNT_0013779975 /DNA_START=391 /DNA_END=636 /DNA_ORIENTATION=+